MINIALGQMEVKPGRPDLNAKTMLAMIESAKRRQADIIVFPELAIPGYLLGDTWEQEAFLRDLEYYGRKIIQASQDLCVMFGNIAVDWTKKNNDGRVRKYNALFTAQYGKLIQPPNLPYPYLIKTLLPNYREFDDSRHFYSLQKLSQELSVDILQLLQPLEIPLGRKKLKIGGLLCEDGWSDDYEVAPLAAFNQKKDLDLAVNISSSPYTLGKNGKRHRLFAKQAIENRIPIVYVNHIGIQNNGKTLYTFDGQSAVYSASGRLLAACPAYQETMRTVKLSFSEADNQSAAPPSLPQEEKETVSIYQALSYGIKNFMQSIDKQKVVVGISGGIDSAVAAALYADILGPQNLLLINMPSVYNSATTKNLSYELAKNLKCSYTVCPIQDAVEHTIKQIESSPIENLADGSQSRLCVSSFAAENIQARDRSARVLAGFAAAWEAVFTCNANKSETTVGYSTLYGDHAGFLAAFADLWKYQIYDLAHYLNEEVYQREVIPKASIDIVPSAELSSSQSVDEGKGDPIKYPYHDYLFRSFVEHWNRAAPADILTWYKEGSVEEKIGCAPGLVKKYFSSTREFIDDLERWWNLYTGMAVAKRIQAPPVLAVSRRAYGFDHREAQNGSYYTAKYAELKKELLK